MKAEIFIHKGILLFWSSQ